MSLLNCPFCGGEPKPHYDGYSYWVICEACECEGPIATNSEKAEEAWNERYVGAPLERP